LAHAPEPEPRKPEASDGPRQSPASDPGPLPDPVGRPTIVVVDDYAFLIESFRRLQDEPGHPFDYEFVNTCEAALARLAQSSPSLVLADYLLSDGYGTDLIPLVREVPVVIMTGHGSERVAIEALRAGASDYLIKDVDGAFLRQVAPTLARVLARGRPGAHDRAAAATRADDAHDLAQFAGLLVSSLSTPIQSILHYCGQLQAHAPVARDRVAASFAGAAALGAKRALATIADAHEYAAVSTSPMAAQRADAAESLREAIAELRSQLDAAGVQVVAENLPDVVVDRRLLRMLWARLLRALLRRRGGRSGEIRVSACARGTDWEFHIGPLVGGDDASGVRAAEVADHGISLAICKRIAERHGGRAWIDVDAGREVACFSLRG
jgi:DNA-binding NarL/FixJ family response regulator